MLFSPAKSKFAGLKQFSAFALQAFFLRFAFGRRRRFLRSLSGHGTAQLLPEDIDIFHAVEIDVGQNLIGNAQLFRQGGDGIPVGRLIAQRPSFLVSASRTISDTGSSSKISSKGASTRWFNVENIPIR